jgi:iron complex transport system substrate-binding protein
MMAPRATLTRRRLLLAAAAAGTMAGLAAARVRAADGARVLILGGDLVEIAYALDAADALVGADDTAVWPPEAEALPKVGYLRRLSAEGMLSLAPDLVLASPAAGPETALRSLSAAGVTVLTGPQGEGFDAVPAKIAFVGQALGRQAQAAALAERVTAEMAQVQAAVARVADHPSVLFLISVGAGAPVASGAGTAADAMIRLAGGRNAVQGFEGYKPLSAEAALGIAPDVALLPDHAARAAGGPEQAMAAAGLTQTPAGRAGRVVVMDGLKLLGFGPRTPQAVGELARALHPDLIL